MPTTIAIDPKTRERLRVYGHAGDTYDDILCKMMDQIDRDTFIAEAQRIIDSPETQWLTDDEIDWQ